MVKKALKGTVLAVTAGSVMAFGGCLSGDIVRTMVPGAALYAGLEFLLDNDGVIDLFEDGNVTLDDAE